MAAKIAIHSARGRWPSTILVAAFTVIGSVACSSDATNPTSLPLSHLYWGVHVNWRAVTMALVAPYNTMQLVATPLDVAGKPLSTDSAVTYTGIDSTVTVSPTGLLTAHYVTSQTEVIAKLTMGGVTHTDTVRIAVTATPFATPVASLSIQPQPGDLDSAKVAATWGYKINSGNGNVPVYVLDRNGNELCDPYDGCPFPVAFQSSDSTIAALDQYGYLTTTNNPGHVTFTASAYVYGVGVQDSLPFWVTYADVQSISITSIGDATHVIPYLNGNKINLGVGGRLIVYNQLPESVEVVLPYETHKIRCLFNANCGASIYQHTDTVPPLSAGVSVINDVAFRFDSAGSYRVQVTPLGPPRGQSVEGAVYVGDGP